MLSEPPWIHFEPTNSRQAPAVPTHTLPLCSPCPTPRSDARTSPHTRAVLVSVPYSATIAAPRCCCPALHSDQRRLCSGDLRAHRCARMASAGSAPHAPRIQLVQMPPGWPSLVPVMVPHPAQGFPPMPMHPWMLSAVPGFAQPPTMIPAPCPPPQTGPRMMMPLIRAPSGIFVPIHSPMHLLPAHLASQATLGQPVMAPCPPRGEPALQAPHPPSASNATAAPVESKFVVRHISTTHTPGHRRKLVLVRPTAMCFERS
jgi:hypothetical protein